MKTALFLAHCEKDPIVTYGYPTKGPAIRQDFPCDDDLMTVCFAIDEISLVGLHVVFTLVYSVDIWLGQICTLR